jgi:excinuclease ABC subunit C
MSNTPYLVEEKLKLLPDQPGVYLMKDGMGEIIYVGKASVLKNRVRSYFNSSHGDALKVKALVSHIVDLEWLITDSELEALILECNLIKKYLPKYNVRLVDDKHYPYIKVTIQERYPRILISRTIKKDGSRYFGPYTRVTAMRETIKLLKKLFPLRTCTNETLNRATRPCLNYHIKRCLGPCMGEVAQKAYQELVKEVLLFLEGKQEILMNKITEKMLEASENMQFEKAAELRDQLKAVESVMEKQKMISPDFEDQDILAMARGNNESCVEIFFVREGKINGREHFMMKNTDEKSRSEVLTAFVQQYYGDIIDYPRELILQEELEDQLLLEAWLTKLKGKKVRLTVPKKGEKLRLIEMVAKNAIMSLDEMVLTRQKKNMMTKEAVLELQQALNLTKPPFRIECYDISNTQGTNSVASMVVFENGEPKISEYRRFKIKTVEGPNDFASMQEVLTRRFKRAIAEMQAGVDGKFATLPDLVIIDGGKGQLSSARKVMYDLGVQMIATFGLAKQEELLFSEDQVEPYVLSRDSHALYLVQRIRDEAHRFAITYHRDLRGKVAHHSVLDEIPGIGPKRRKALIKTFGSVRKMKEATVTELAQVEGMNMKAALSILEYLGTRET